jgi:hypothetical protein
MKLKDIVPGGENAVGPIEGKLIRELTRESVPLAISDQRTVAGGEPRRRKYRSNGREDDRDGELDISIPSGGPPICPGVGAADYVTGGSPAAPERGTQCNGKP